MDPLTEYPLTEDPLSEDPQTEYPLSEDTLLEDTLAVDPIVVDPLVVDSKIQKRKIYIIYCTHHPLISPFLSSYLLSLSPTPSDYPSFTSIWYSIYIILQLTSECWENRTPDLKIMSHMPYP